MTITSMYRVELLMFPLRFIHSASSWRFLHLSLTPPSRRKSHAPNPGAIVYGECSIKCTCRRREISPKGIPVFELRMGTPSIPQRCNIYCLKSELANKNIASHNAVRSLMQISRASFDKVGVAINWVRKNGNNTTNVESVENLPRNTTFSDPNALALSKGKISSIGNLKRQTPCERCLAGNTSETMSAIFGK